MVITRISSTILNTSQESRHPFLVPGFSGSVFSPPAPSSLIEAVCLSYKALQFEVYSHYSKIFCHGKMFTNKADLNREWVYYILTFFLRGFSLLIVLRPFQIFFVLFWCLRLIFVLCPFVCFCIHV